MCQKQCGSCTSILFSHQAKYLVIGDSHVRALKEYTWHMGVKVVSLPGATIKSIRRQALSSARTEQQAQVLYLNVGELLFHASSFFF